MTESKFEPLIESLAQAFDGAAISLEQRQSERDQTRQTACDEWERIRVEILQAEEGKRQVLREFVARNREGTPETAQKRPRTRREAREGAGRRGKRKMRLQARRKGL
jgi:hypothetical protein